MTPTLARAVAALPPEALFSLVAVLVVLAVFFVSRMTPKRFYIVRHGETLLNEQHIKQGAEGKLNEKGRAQAERVGRFLQGLSIKLILTSPYERAVETAAIIQGFLKVPVQPTPLLAERRNPTAVLGKSTMDPEVQRIVNMIERGYHEDDFRFGDEENFADLKKRSAECLRYLERVTPSRIAVVTHHALLQMLLSYMLYRESLHAEVYVKLAFFNPAENAGVTVCEYRPWKRFTKAGGWKIITYSQAIP